MTIKQAIEILRTHNEWRRGAEDIQPYAPSVIGEAIDVVGTEFLRERKACVHSMHQAMYYLEILKNKEQP